MDSIERLRVKNSQLLNQLIKTHLSFIIESDFELILNPKQPKRKFVANSSVFGANLTQEGICSVHQLIEFITNDCNIIKEGIFRKSGSSLRQSELRELISSGITVDLTANRFTVHDCCSVLKKFVSELPEPLLTESHYELFRQISDLNPKVLTPNKIYAKKLTAIQLLLLLIPAPNKQLLKELLNLFEKVIQKCDLNKMCSTNLATIFAPHLFLPRTFTAIELQQNLDSITSTLIYMIDNSHIICDPPKQLVSDVKQQLQIIDSMKDEVSSSSLAAVNSTHQFCIPTKEVNNEDFTANQMAELYAYIQSMPKSGTPMKKKWIKRFNRENGKGTPLLKQKSESAKKFKSSFGGVLKAGQQLLFGSSDDISKQKKSNKTLAFDSPLKCDTNDKQIYKKLTPIETQISGKNRTEEDYQLNNESVTPITISLENATKRVRLSVRKVGNREPIVM